MFFQRRRDRRWQTNTRCVAFIFTLEAALFQSHKKMNDGGIRVPLVPLNMNTIILTETIGPCGESLHDQASNSTSSQFFSIRWLPEANCYLQTFPLSSLSIKFWVLTLHDYPRFAHNLTVSASVWHKIKRLRWFRA